MLASREFTYLTDDVVVLTADVDGCPAVEIPLTEVFDFATSTLVDKYLQVFHRYVIEILEGTAWMDIQSFSSLLRAGYGLHHPMCTGEILAMPKPALQGLILQNLRRSNDYDEKFAVPLLIRFLVHGTDRPHRRRRSDLSRDAIRSVIPTTKKNTRCPPIVQVLNSASDKTQHSYDVGSNLQVWAVIVATDKPTTGVSGTQLQRDEGKTTQASSTTRFASMISVQDATVLKDHRVDFSGTVGNNYVAINHDAHVGVQHVVGTYSDGTMDVIDMTHAIIVPVISPTDVPVNKRSDLVTAESNPLTALADDIKVGMYGNGLHVYLDCDGGDSRSRLAKCIRNSIAGPLGAPCTPDASYCIPVERLINGPNTVDQYCIPRYNKSADGCVCIPSSLGHTLARFSNVNCSDTTVLANVQPDKGHHTTAIESPGRVPLLDSMLLRYQPIDRGRHHMHPKHLTSILSDPVDNTQAAAGFSQIVEGKGPGTDGIVTSDNEIPRGVQLGAGVDGTGNNVVDRNNGSCSGSVKDANCELMSQVPTDLVDATGIVRNTAITQDDHVYIFASVKPGKRTVKETDRTCILFGVCDFGCSNEIDASMEEIRKDHPTRVILPAGEMDTSHYSVESSDVGITETTVSTNDNPIPIQNVRCQLHRIAADTPAIIAISLTDTNKVYSFVAVMN